MYPQFPYQHYSPVDRQPWLRLAVMDSGYELESEGGIYLTLGGEINFPFIPRRGMNAATMRGTLPVCASYGDSQIELGT